MTFPLPMFRVPIPMASMTFDTTEASSWSERIMTPELLRWPRFVAGGDLKVGDCIQTSEELLITADAGGSNGSRLRLWKLELQKLAERYWSLDSCLSLSAGNQQMEQGRAPTVFVHLVELAW